MGTKKYSNYKSLEDAIHEIAHESPLNLDQQADMLNVNRSTYYRYVNRYDDTKFPVNLLIPFMRLHKDEDPLRRQANDMGFMLVKIPRGSLTHPHMMHFLAQYQKDFQTLFSELLEFFSKDINHAQRLQAMRNITRHIEHSAGIREQVKEENGQYNLFGGENER